MTASDRLGEALAELRASVDLSAPRHRGAWAKVVAFVRTVPPPDDDLRQETVIRIHRGVARFEGASDAEAAAWIRRVHKHKAIDASRSGARDPVAKGLRLATHDDEGTSPLDRLAAPEGSHSAGALDAFRDHLFDAIDDMLHAKEPSASKRLLRRTEARAAFYRLVHELDVAALKRELGPHATDASDAQVYKWVERGRDVLSGQIAALAKEGARGPLGGDALATLSELLQNRRADAGRARKNTEASVSRPGAAPSMPKKPPSGKSRT